MLSNRFHDKLPLMKYALPVTVYLNLLSVIFILPYFSFCINHPWLVDKKFQKVGMTSKHNARKKNTKRKEVSKVKFITTVNPVLPNYEGLIKKHIHYLHSAAF